MNISDYYALELLVERYGPLRVITDLSKLLDHLAIHKDFEKGNAAAAKQYRRYADNLFHIVDGTAP